MLNIYFSKASVVTQELCSRFFALPYASYPLRGLTYMLRFEPVTRGVEPIPMSPEVTRDAL